MDPLLEAVARAAEERRTAQRRLEAEIRAAKQLKLEELERKLDIACRIASDAGYKQADIMRAYPTKDARTIRLRLQRTSPGEFGTPETEKAAPPYQLEYKDSGIHLLVKYVDHGPREVTGGGTFKVFNTEDGAVMFSSVRADPEVEAVLDGRFEGFYYDEALQFIYHEEGSK